MSADLELLKHLEEELDEDIGLQQFGAIDIASSDSEIEEIKKICAKLTAEFILNSGKTSIPIDLLKPERYYNMKFDIPKYYSYDMLERLLGEWDL